MKIVVDLPEYLVDRARKLISREEYRDLSSFVAASIENQLTLEETTPPPGTLLSRHTKEEAELASGVLMPLQSDFGFPPEGVPTLAYHARPRQGPEDEWPWGQINKLLPVKFAVRLLALQVSSTQPVIPLDDFREDAALKARILGLWLARNDARLNRRWGERLSTAFPIGKGRKEKTSLSRYASHFVGSRRKKDSAVFGALFELQLASPQVEGTVVSLGLTEGGLQFARLPNPVLDNQDLSSALGEQEARFYLGHIRSRVPGEARAFALILTLLAEGVNRREELNEQIKGMVAFRWTDKVVNTQRAGAMARMVDLGLVQKVKEGLAVEYQITERGRAWLADAG